MCKESTYIAFERKKLFRGAFNLQPGQNNYNTEKSASCGREIIHLTLLEINVLQISYDALNCAQGNYPTEAQLYIRDFIWL